MRNRTYDMLLAQRDQMTHTNIKHANPQEIL